MIGWLYFLCFSLFWPIVQPDLTQKEMEIQDERVKELLIESQSLPFVVELFKENQVQIEALDDDQISKVNIKQRVYERLFTSCQSTG